MLLQVDVVILANQHRQHLGVLVGYAGKGLSAGASSSANIDARQPGSFWKGF